VRSSFIGRAVSQLAALYKAKAFPTFLAIALTFLQLFLIYKFKAASPLSQALNGTLTTDDEETTNGEAQVNGSDSGSENGEGEATPENGTGDGETNDNGDGSESGGSGQQPSPEPEPEPQPEPEPPPPPEPEIILCLGNSVTYGSPYGPNQGYPTRLQTKLNATYGSGTTSVINKGQPGWTADQVLASTSGWLNTYNPDVVLLMVGGNDLNTCTPENFESVINQTVAEVQSIVNTAKAHGSQPRVILSAFIPNRKVGFVGSMVVNWFNAGYHEFGVDIDGLVTVSNTDRYFTSNWIDLYNSGEGMAHASLMADEVHPNTQGYEIIADNWSAEVVGFLQIGSNPITRFLIKLLTIPRL
jgi:lysophospholipase L1-like esterase